MGMSIAHLPVGARVRFVRAVERFPFFTVPEGATGVVTASALDFFAVKLDLVIPEAEDWDNEVHWDGVLLGYAPTDVELVNTAPTGAV